MFTQEDNKLLVGIGPGTPMGALFRRFWLPFLLPEELPAPDCPPIRVTLLGEQLIAFRDTNGRVGLLDRYCAHRRVDLYYGRNEHCGLRCAYHGWKYDVDGKVLDMPAEPANTPLKKEVRQKSYPVREWGGVIWAYMGDRSGMPSDPPHLEWGMVPEDQRYVTKRLQENNYAQSVEGGIDSSHVSILHSELEPEPARGFRDRQKSILPEVPFLASDTAPRFFVRENDYGMLIGARREASEEEYYWRITQFLLPFYTIIAPNSQGAPYMGHAWTPIDDHHTWTFTMTWNPDGRLSPEERDMRQVHAEVAEDGSFRQVRNRDNDYLISREEQRLRSCTGIEGIGAQDAAIQESMGPIVDRSRETLGVGDTAIVAFRRRLLKMARELEQGTEPAMPHHPEWYQVRSAGLVLKKGLDFEVAARPMLKAV